jgi:opacity protein-like surface antigen
MITDQVAVGVDGYFSRNGLNTEERDLVRLIDPTFDLKFTQFGGAAHLKYFFPISESPLDVYLVGGAGFTNFKIEATAGGISASESDNRFSGYGGIGLGYEVGSNVSLGIQSDFNYVNLEGGSAPSLGVKAGVMFGIPRAGGE